MKDTIKSTYLAADFGGGSGRLIAGSLFRGKLEMEEIHRFPNRQVRLGNHIYWDFPALFEDLKTGLRLAAQKGYAVKGIGIDTWGVDFGLIDRNGNLVGNPVCYRDGRTDGLPPEVFRILDERKHYEVTGIQVMAINTLFQLYSMQKNREPQLEIARRLLFMPDLFSYFLTGVANNEYCIASTSELLDAKSRNWSEETIRALGFPEHLFGEIIQPGSIRGTLKEDIARETGLGPVDVIAVGSHDTASAVAAVPAAETPIAFLSSGTWSLLGVETEEPILTEEARQARFTNEGGVGGRIRFLQNITGLWILQRLMDEWKARGEGQSYDTIIPQAAKVGIDTIIPVDAPEFMNPENMENALMDYCRRHALHVPQTKAETVKCVLQSLAFKYRQAVEKLNRCLPSPIRCLNIIGGGSQNKLLNQLTADALDIPVYAGPAEATAIGNILTQAMAKGEIADLQELREIVCKSITPEIYYPKK
ncbi:rhamnulokinase family protein [uncultured Bacteroides sp.]|uniref:rhamnulokinase n=1 Tax=uncultured Bacteroides sp. TaxID=162156 RepID=UPI002674DF60|nr:rhamnulokinase family protein [uncultured Bacteroides sp.]